MESRVEVNILIDQITNCLRESKSNKLIETEYTILRRPFDNEGWMFDWKNSSLVSSQIYELHVKDSKVAEGRVSLTLCDNYVEVQLVEAASHNIGALGRYIGVGGHLFAIACKISLDSGFGGAVVFTAKSDLIEHYRKTLGAILLNSQRMIIDENAAQRLINTYFKK